MLCSPTTTAVEPMTASLAEMCDRAARAERSWVRAWYRAQWLVTYAHLADLRPEQKRRVMFVARLADDRASHAKWLFQVTLRAMSMLGHGDHTIRLNRQALGRLEATERLAWHNARLRAERRS